VQGRETEVQELLQRGGGAEGVLGCQNEAAHGYGEWKWCQKATRKWCRIHRIWGPLRCRPQRDAYYDEGCPQGLEQTNLDQENGFMQELQRHRQHGGAVEELHLG